MTLNGHYALYCAKHASFGVHHEKLNEDRPILPEVKCRLGTLVSGSVRLMPTFAGNLWREGANYTGAVGNGNFQLFLSLAYFSKLLAITPTLLYKDVKSVVRSPPTLKHVVTLSDLEWPFYVNFCFNASTMSLGVCGFRRQLLANE